jgi:hypothetical protein
MRLPSADESVISALGITTRPPVPTPCEKSGLTDQIDRRCSILADDHATIKAGTHFHWWPAE